MTNAGRVVMSSMRPAPYMPRSLLTLSLISLLDIDNPSSVMIDAMVSYSQACSAFHDGGGEEADAAPGRHGISDKVAFNFDTITWHHLELTIFGTN